MGVTENDVVVFAGDFVNAGLDVSRRRITSREPPIIRPREHREASNPDRDLFPFRINWIQRLIQTSHENPAVPRRERLLRALRSSTFRAIVAKPSLRTLRSPCSDLHSLKPEVAASRPTPEVGYPSASGQKQTSAPHKMRSVSGSIADINALISMH